jgi:poly(3-hydroxybutyrate) depolymerase
MLVTAAATNQRRAAVIMLHGYTATPADAEAVSGWTKLMTGTDVLVAYPEGSATPYGGYGWSTGAARFATTGSDDITDINNVITKLIVHDCVGQAQIMVAGESNGSGLGLILGCNAPTAHRVKLFALAIPAVDTGVLKHCIGSKPFPLLVIASLHDRTVTYNGKYPPGVAPFAAPLSWFEKIATSVDGCAGLRETPVPDGTHFWYLSCTIVANFYVANDGQHTWPGGPEGTAGLNPGRFPAAKLAWCASRLNATRFPVNCATIASAYGLQAPSSAIAPLSFP